jgi:hypothetical protein
MNRPLLATAILAALVTTAMAQPAPAPLLPGMTPTNGPPGTPVAPAWAYPESPGYRQVAPPPDFHRPPLVINQPIGVFEGRADVGGTLVPGSATFADGKYTINSAGYNVWYNRDEFHFLWKRMSGDVSLAADIAYPNPAGFFDRKAVLMIRQSLDDDSKMMVVALHGAGMIHIAWRPEKGARVQDMEYRIGSRGGLPGGASPDSLVTLIAKRLGIQKQGDNFTLWTSERGEPMHQVSGLMPLRLDGPFYVGIGFTSHLPTVSDTAVLSNVVLENAAGRVR